jgi:hypothetical protein
VERISLTRWLVTGAAAGFSAFVFAQFDPNSDASGLPPLAFAGGIPYRSGGVGKEEEEAFEAAMRRAPLSFKFYMQEDGEGVFASDVGVNISPIGGASIFTAKSDGPFMIVDVPPGRYRVTASLQGVIKVQNVRIGTKDHHTLTFSWGPLPEPPVPDQ